MLISWKLDRKFHYAINEAVGAHRWYVENVFRWNLSIWCEEYQKALKCFAFSFRRVCLHMCVSFKFQRFFSFFLFFDTQTEKNCYISIVISFINQFSSTQTHPSAPHDKQCDIALIFWRRESTTKLMCVQCSTILVYHSHRRAHRILSERKSIITI